MSENTSLLPPNRSQLMRDLEKSGCRLGELETLHRWLHNPDLCPEHILPWLAWAVSIELWSDDWPAEARRNLIKRSIHVHRKKGTVGAVKYVLDALNIRAEISEWFEFGGTPHTFVLTAWVNDNLFTTSDILLDEALYNAIIKGVNEVKPVRSHFDFRVGLAFDNGLAMACTTSTVALSQQDFDILPNPMDQSAALATTSITQMAGVALLKTAPQFQPYPHPGTMMAGSVTQMVVLVHLVMET